MKKFLIIWSGQALSLFGSSVVQFALIWYLTKETGSATVLATATIVALLPALVLMPFIGVWVDRWNRKRIMIIADLSTALATVGLAALFYAGVVEVWHIYALTLLRSLGGAFHGPAMMATTPLLVPEKHLVRVNSLNQMVAGAMNIIAPPLGALFLELLPMQGVLAIDVVTALVAASCLVVIAIPQPARVYANGKTTVFTDIKEGFKFIWSWPGLVILVAGAALLNFFGAPVESLSPLLIIEHFHGGVTEMGWMQSCMGGGMIAGGVILGTWGGFKKRMMTSIAGMILLAVVVTMAGFVPENMFWWFAVCVFCFGAANTVTNSPIIAMFQILVPKDIQGRLFTLVNTACMVMAPLGLAVAGPVAEKFGVQTWYILTGIVILTASIIYICIPSVRNIESHKMVINKTGTAVEPPQAPPDVTSQS